MKMLLPFPDWSGKRTTKMWNEFLHLIQPFSASLSPSSVSQRDKTFFKTKDSQHIFKVLPPASSPSSRVGRNCHICRYVLPLMSSLSSMILCCSLETLQGLLEQILAGEKRSLLYRGSHWTCVLCLIHVEVINTCVHLALFTHILGLFFLWNRIFLWDLNIHTLIVIGFFKKY